MDVSDADENAPVMAPLAGDDTSAAVQPEDGSRRISQCQGTSGKAVGRLLGRRSQQRLRRNGQRRQRRKTQDGTLLLDRDGGRKCQIGISALAPVIVGKPWHDEYKQSPMLKTLTLGVEGKEDTEMCDGGLTTVQN